MELNFKAVKALSSPTRVKILNEILKKESTPTQLSDNLGKSKSTISSHLSTLHTAGLIEKDEKEGRKRVVYSPTRKADAIVNGKERKVRFSIASSALSMVVALFAIGAGVRDSLSMQSAAQSSDQVGAMTTMSQESMRTASETTSSMINLSPEILFFIGAGLLAFSATGIFYGFVIKNLTE